MAVPENTVADPPGAVIVRLALPDTTWLIWVHAWSPQVIELSVDIAYVPPQTFCPHATPGTSSNAAAASSVAARAPETGVPAPAAFVREDGPEKEARPGRPAWPGLPPAASRRRAFMPEPRRTCTCGGGGGGG